MSKIILTGTTGVVGLECLRLALLHPDVKEVIALGRRPVSAPQDSCSDAEKAKLKNVIVQDMGKEYPEDVKEKLRDADGCIWNLAVTPKKTKELHPDEVKKICHDYTIIGLQAMLPLANPDHPFRLIYTSGSMTERDQHRDLWVMADYRRMRGAVENAVLEEAANSKGRLEVQIQKPGAVLHSQRGAMERIMIPIVSAFGVGSLHVSEVAASELDQILNGFGGKDTLGIPDMVKTGREALQKWGVQKATF